MAVVATGLATAPAAADETSDLAELLDLTRPELADVAAELADGDAEGAAEELQQFYADRTDVVLPEPNRAGVGQASADELAEGIFRFDGVTRDFYDEEAQRIDVDWQDTWDGTEEEPGKGQVWMSDFAFMPTLTRAYMSEQNPQVRAEYAQAWMEITLDFFADNPDWPRNKNLAGAKRLSQLITSFSVFRTEPTIDAGELVDYLMGTAATTDHLVDALPAHRGNNWYLSMARSIYLASVYLPELADAYEQEHFAVRSFESFLTQHGAQFKGDSVYREPTVNYQAYAADLVNATIEVADLNDRTLPASIIRATDWIADSLFATRMPNLEAPLFGDAGNVDAGQRTIAASGERNSWSDFSWVASDRAEGTAPTLGSTIYPISFAVQRSGWDADARYMHINNQNTSYTYSHRHPDDLSLIMAAYGRPLIVDPGSGDYTSTGHNSWMRRETEAHNTIEVDGQPQEAGITRASYLWRSNEGLDVYRGEAHGYRPVIHDRVVYFVKPGFWIVSDALTGDTETHDYRQLWHFPGDPVSVAPETDVATVGFDTVPGADPVSGVQLVPVGAGSTDVAPTVHEDGAARVGDEVRTDIDFLSYDWTTEGATGLDTVVVPGEAGPAPSVTADRIEMPGVDHSVASALEIDLEGATGQFYLSREEVPSSRSFGSATTDGETAYLERDDAGTLTRYALTSGSSLTDDGATIATASGTVSDLSVRLEGDTAEVSLSDPFTGTLQLSAASADEVLVNGELTEFTRAGEVITISLAESFTPALLFEDDFDESSLESTAYDFADGSLQGWRPRPGDSWELGGPDGTQLAQTSTANRQSFAIQQDVPADVHISAEIVPGDRSYATARTGLAFRYNDSRNYYRANVVKTREGVSLQLLKIYNGELTVLDEADLAIDPDAAHTLSVSAVGRNLVATVGDTSVSVDDGRLPTGGVGAFTHRQATLFDNITIAEALDEDHWQSVRGDISVDAGQLQMTPTGDRAHALLTSALPSRFSDTCDYAVTTTMTLGDTGSAGISLRDNGNSYGYRIHIGKTSRNTQYASIIREAHRSGPEKIGGASVSHSLDGPVELGATIHGDHITVTLNGETILEARDTLVRSGGVGLYANSEASFENVNVSGGCEPPGSDNGAELAPWEEDSTYTEGDRVTYEDAVWSASWWTQGQEPGDPYGPWQEMATTAGGTAWTPSRIFTEGDVAAHDDQRYQAQWWSRNDQPGDPHGPWEPVEG
ncbi:heparinase II/III family protein [Ruania rhizosphaerae]|uniref:heparinase II/III family protein n=1 Tax=Ruania rhizosphaerae TaxID=1840413 RepID=UPI00135698AF|nr:heparinase II/III family protein [Ruania rhizosphaerae]